MRILKTLHWSRRRSGSGVADIHLQQSQLQDNNNGLVPRDTKESIECVGPDGMWAPGSTPGHHRELPVDVPDTLLQQAYANKVMTTDPKNNHHRNELPRRNRNASIDKLSSSLPPLPPTLPPQPPDLRELSLNQKNESTNVHLRPYNQKHNSNNKVPFLSGKMKDTDEKLPRIIEITVQNNNKHNENDTNNMIKSRELLGELSDDDEIDSGTVERQIHTPDVKETNVDVEDDYPFAKEDYPTMLKTCSDDSASPRSSSGRSDSTAALDASLILPGKESPLYDARRIDLGSPCRTMPDLGPLFGLTTRETTSFDNPAYGLDLHDFHPGLLIRSDEVTDLTRLIGEQTTNSRKNSKLNQDKNLSSKGPISRVGDFAKSSLKKSKNKQTLITKNSEYEGESLIGVSSTDDLLSADLTSFVSNTSIKKQKSELYRSSGYSTLRSDTSNDHHNDHSFLITGNNNRVYREVAVDCPPDFIPITKSHPIYPPPNKIDGKRDIHFETQHINKRKDDSLSLKDKLNYPNVLSTFESSSSTITTTTPTATTTTTSQIDGNIKACIDDHNSLIDDESTNEHKHVKVRSKVKSLLRQSFHNNNGELQQQQGSNNNNSNNINNINNNGSSNNNTLNTSQNSIYRILSNTFTTPKIFYCTLSSSRYSTPHYLDLINVREKIEPCVGKSFKRLYDSFRNDETNDNSRNSLCEFNENNDQHNKFVDDDDDENNEVMTDKLMVEVNTNLDNVENFALSNAYEESFAHYFLPNSSSSPLPSSSLRSIRRNRHHHNHHRSVEDITNCCLITPLEYKRRHTLDERQTRNFHCEIVKFDGENSNYKDDHDDNQSRLKVTSIFRGNFFFILDCFISLFFFSKEHQFYASWDYYLGFIHDFLLNQIMNE
ncbi:hypothetical protein PV327_009797 [Microctonus hyperodae]|uniref:Uncharacterized protein n=1 Tax=Microctonus hyperodae TaxID=165561 RepID=A0AA39CBT1_MICHY|nr:hypothetical protein PV327_009797 [Microctonus hyperodae]